MPSCSELTTQNCARRYSATRLGSLSARLVVVNRRRRAGHAVARVDVGDLAVDLDFDRAVAREIRPRRDADLDEGQPAAQLRAGA